MTKDEYLAHLAAVYRVANMSGSDNPAKEKWLDPSLAHHQCGSIEKMLGSLVEHGCITSADRRSLLQQSPGHHSGPAMTPSEFLGLLLQAIDRDRTMGDETDVQDLQRVADAIHVTLESGERFAVIVQSLRPENQETDRR